MNLGLGYESSDEEETAPIAPVAKPEKPVANDKTTTVAPPPNPQPPAPQPEPAPAAQPPPPQPSIPDAPLSGPALGPPTTISGPPDAPSTPGSPYTSTRTTIRNLTLPITPNFAIPPSPPGSPPPASTKKFTQFISLKSKGVHFNQRLESSSVLKDPAHLRRLMEFAGIKEEDMYASTLPDGVGVPTRWEKGAYVEELRESQKRIGKRREEEQRGGKRAVEFVPAAPSPAGSTAVGGTGMGKRKELEQRGGRDSRWGTGERSPKRKR